MPAQFEDMNVGFPRGAVSPRNLDINNALENFSFTIVNLMDGKAELAFPNRDGVVVFHPE
jgi:hypothetical protein